MFKYKYTLVYELYFVGGHFWYISGHKLAPLPDKCFYIEYHPVAIFVMFVLSCVTQLHNVHLAYRKSTLK